VTPEPIEFTTEAERRRLATVVEQTIEGTTPLIVVHAPADPLLMTSPSFAGRRNARQMLPTLCGTFAKLPPTVEVKTTPEGEPYFVAKPHRRYYGWCPDCSERSPRPLYPVAR
jgi:hypothetical protein